MTIPVYDTGAVSVAANGTDVSNGGTAIWSNGNVKEGDWIVIDGDAMTMVLAVVDTEHITIPEWQGGAKTNVEYAIYQNYSARDDSTAIAKDVGILVAALNKEGFIWFVGPDETSPDPSRGDEGQFAYQPSTGKQWYKDGGEWVYNGVFKGFGAPAPYDNSKTYSLNDVATSGGSSYVWNNSTPGAGHAPPNATYWAVLAAKGEQGIQGITGASYAATSSTSLTIGTGSKTLTVAAGLAYVMGSRIRVASAGSPTNYMEGICTAYTGTSITISMLRASGSGTFSDWTLSIAGDPGSGDMLSTNNLAEVVDIGEARENLGLGSAAIADLAVLGQCQFRYVSATSAELVPKNGNQIFIAGKLMKIPSGGVSTGSLTSLTANTRYYAYAYDNAGSVALEVVTTAHVTDPTYGHERKDGDGSRTLVGMLYTNSGGLLVNTESAALVRSWFNRQATATRAAFTSNRDNSGFGGAQAEVNQEIRNSVVLWADEVWDIAMTATFSLPSAGQSASVGIGVDSSTVWKLGSVNYNGDTSGNRMVAPVIYKASGLSEGYHFATLIVRSVSGVVATFNGIGSAGSDSGTSLTGHVVSPAGG